MVPSIQNNSWKISITLPDIDSKTSYDSDLSATEPTVENLFYDLSSLYTSNESLKEDVSSRKRGAGGKETKVTEKLEGFLESFVKGANKVLEELMVVGASHPVLALAIYAFHEVVKLDIARRDNEKKVLTVLLEMQNMLLPMLQLRNLSREHMPGVERRFHEERLRNVVDVIKKDIEQCRSDITHFMDRKAVYKLVLAKGYEKKFAFHMETFSQRRVELQTIVTEYTAIGISTVNISLAGLSKKVDVANDRLDIIISLFRRLDNLREKDVFSFFDQHNGPENCVNDRNLLSKLIAKVGESPKTGKNAISDETELEALQKDLINALKENLDEVLEKNFSRFEKVLHVKMNQVSEQLDDQGIKIGKILAAVTTKAVKLKDPEIQRVWMSMNVTGNVVKAKVFVLTFRDHVRAGKSTVPTPRSTTMPLPGVGTNSSRLQVQTGAGAYPDLFGLVANPDKESDDWVLDYIDVAYVQPIVEAMDEDGSGFISVQEANKFAAARPKGMSLLHWIAYWAAGWHINIIKYQTEIFAILLQMNEVLPEIHIANRVYVDDFLDNPILTRVDALLRSIRPRSNTNDQNLVDVANTVASHQLDRLKKNLTYLGHVVESGLVATTIANGTRVETWILPIIFLLLQHHLNVIKLAKTVVLDPLEFDVHIQSLQSIFFVFDERMKVLEAKFCQLHSDMDARFQSFSYGMFYAAFKKTEFSISDNILMTLRLDDYKHSIEDDKPTILDTSILSKPVGKTIEIDEPLVPLAAPDGHVPHPVEGVWLGKFDHWMAGAPNMVPFHCIIHPIVGNDLKGEVEGYPGRFKLSGTVDSHSFDDSPHVKSKIQFDFLHSGGSSAKVLRCHGYFDGTKQIITGACIWNWLDDNDEESAKTSQPISPAAAENEKSPMQTSIDLELERSEAPSNDSDYRSTETEPRCGSTSEDVSRVSEVDTLADSTIESGSIVLNLPGRGRFYFTRTPAHLSRFRNPLDGGEPCSTEQRSLFVRKRWVFAIKSVIADTRTRFMPRQAFNEALSERRKWLYYSIRFNMTDSDVAFNWYKYEPMTEKEWDVYETLLSSVSPLSARIYEEMALYMYRRETYLAPVGRARCDLCQWNIAFIRHQCITCKDDDLSRLDCIDICYGCIDKPFRPFLGKFSHNQSHSLLRSPHRIHQYEFSTAIPQARLISERIKARFRALEEAKRSKKPTVSRAMKGKGVKESDIHDGNVTKTATQAEAEPIICACCKDTVSLPCWVCIVCTSIFFCYSCERKNALITVENHTHSRFEHQILRIYDSVEVKPYRSYQVKDVGRQLEEIHTSISLLDEKISKQFQAAQQEEGEAIDTGKSMDDAQGQKNVGRTTSTSDISDRSDDKDETLSLIDEEAHPTQPTPVFGLTNTSAENIQSDLGKRMDILEGKVGNLEAKIDTLLTLVQSISRS